MKPLAKTLGLKVVDIPFAIDDVQCKLLYHNRYSQVSFYQEVVEHIKQAIRS